MFPKVQRLTQLTSDFVDLYIDPQNSSQLLLGFNKTVLLNPANNLVLLSSLFRRGALNLDPRPLALAPAAHSVVIAVSNYL